MTNDEVTETGNKNGSKRTTKNASAKPKRSVADRRPPVPLKETMNAFKLIEQGTGTNQELLNAGVDANNLKRIVNTLKKQGLIRIEVKYVITDVADATSV